ncbi:proline-rich protein HaeIII subfamily 1-like [Corythoichthys intestinalis]|uniref:proline-rich protein HaeIII subfamily 1-like n=1 Tax=Corythoichthys intestinalis TaxID=161448 RepID=UPI0025A5106F|nr:proline-rich protein HaeIII subfamily 1-like [Corythoichthys intestinalis]
MAYALRDEEPCHLPPRPLPPLPANPDPKPPLKPHQPTWHTEGPPRPTSPRGRKGTPPRGGNALPPQKITFIPQGATDSAPDHPWHTSGPPRPTGPGTGKHPHTEEAKPHQPSKLAGVNVAHPSCRSSGKRATIIPTGPRAVHIHTQGRDEGTRHFPSRPLPPLPANPDPKPLLKPYQPRRHTEGPRHPTTPQGRKGAPPGGGNTPPPQPSAKWPQSSPQEPRAAPQIIRAPLTSPQGKDEWTPYQQSPTWTSSHRHNPKTDVAHCGTPTGQERIPTRRKQHPATPVTRGTECGLPILPQLRQRDHHHPPGSQGGPHPRSGKGRGDAPLSPTPAPKTTCGRKGSPTAGSDTPRCPRRMPR